METSKSLVAYIMKQIFKPTRQNSHQEHLNVSIWDMLQDTRHSKYMISKATPYTYQEIFTFMSTYYPSQIRKHQIMIASIISCPWWFTLESFKPWDSPISLTNHWKSNLIIIPTPTVIDSPTISIPSTSPILRRSQRTTSKLAYLNDFIATATTCHLFLYPWTKFLCSSSHI